ncbi:MAG: hypothetical protein R2831_10965 [Chitinophagaceae bacterium]
MPVKPLTKLQRKRAIVLKKIQWVRYAIDSPVAFTTPLVTQKRIEKYMQLSQAWCELSEKINLIINKKTHLMFKYYYIEYTMHKITKRFVYKSIGYMAQDAIAELVKSKVGKHGAHIYYCEISKDKYYECLYNPLLAKS